MLVVTGTQRSGTSLIAKALIESGYDLGASWFDEEVQGGYENEVICAFYRWYLGDPTFPFDDFELPTYQYAAIVFKNFDQKVAKFCYLLMNPAFVMIWHKFRPKGDTFLIMNRSKKDVILSKERIPERFHHDSLLLDQTSEQLHENFLQSWTLLVEHYRTVSLSFPACTTYEILHINRDLAKLDPTVQIKPEVWKRTLDTSKIHF